MTESKDTMEGLVQELRRGTQVLGVLSQLKEPMYGYTLVNALSEKGMEIDKNTLYPLLRRLEKQALLVSEWNVEESRPRRYYVLSEKGKRVLHDLRAEWDILNETIKRLTQDE